MAKPNQLARLVPSPSLRSFAPLAPFLMPALPAKLSGISADDSAKWRADVEESIRQQFRLLEEKINAIIDSKEAATVITSSDTPISTTPGSKGDKGEKGDEGTPGANGSPGATGAAGTDGEDGSQWYAGAGVPSDAIGVNGDFYLNLTNGDVYEKSGGTWL